MVSASAKRRVCSGVSITSSAPSGSFAPFAALWRSAWLAVVALCCVGTLGATALAQEGRGGSATGATAKAPRAPKTVRLAVVGHVVVATDSNEKGRYHPPNSGEGLVDEVAALMAHADLRIGNLAAPISDRGVVKPGVDNDRRWAFRTPPRYANVLKTLGFDVMLTANNHILDYGPLAEQDTLERLKAMKIGSVGRIDEVYRRRINGVRVAVIGMTQPYHPTFSSHHDIELAGEQVAALVGKADLIVVLVHGGGEGREFKHVRRNKEYAGREYRGRIVKLARHLVDRGADLVIGFGSHMPRAMELYEGRLIAYALGNFLTYGPFDLKTPNNLSAILEVELARSGQLVDARVTPLRLVYPGVPRFDERNWATKYLRKMSRIDFPESPVVIGLDGVIEYKPGRAPPTRVAASARTREATRAGGGPGEPEARGTATAR